MPPTTKRTKVPTPMVTLASLRASHGLTQEALATKVAAITGQTFTNASLSAIEKGHRGASRDTLSALETSLHLKPGSLLVTYEPSHARRPALEEVAS